ncbi:MAG: Clp1/GlmU family protein [Candidatus Bathyarchaeia archaeon]
MQQTVESNRTLLVDGPASVRVVSGKVEVFGYQVKQSSRIVVRDGKRLPFFVHEKAVFDVSLGVNASIEETAGSTTPQSWNKPVEAVLSVLQKPVVVLIVGKIDSGKSSFCTYLVNKLVNEKCKVAVLDSDLGQSDIGPSGTVGYALTSKPVTDLYNLRLENAFFVGVTSPISAIAKTVEGLAAIKAEILEKPVDVMVVNTDGWVTGDIAVKYKLQLEKELKPNVIVGVQVEDELASLIANIEDTPLIVVEPSASLKQRSEEKRKSLREMTYARYLKDTKLQCYPMSQLVVEEKSALPTDKDADKALLVGLYGSGSKFLGVGVLREINQMRRVLKVQTAVTAKPSRIVIGKVLLDEKLREIQD